MYDTYTTGKIGEGTREEHVLPDLPVPILAAVARAVKGGPLRVAAVASVGAGQSLVTVLEVAEEAVVSGGVLEAPAEAGEVVEARDACCCWWCTWW